MTLLVDHRNRRADRPTRRDRRRLRRALRERDRLSDKLAELHRIDTLLAEATHVVERGWMQHGWFAYVDPSGVRHVVIGCTPRLARTLDPEQVVTTCLVGAIVHAAGGPAQVRNQLVQRTLDVTWHASFRGAREPIRWCPSSAERAGHVMDLVRWNDHPVRNARDVTALLERARALASAEAEQARSRLHAR
jgi:hypothetical protein